MKLLGILWSVGLRRLIHVPPLHRHVHRRHHPHPGFYGFLFWISSELRLYAEWRWWVIWIIPSKIWNLIWVHDNSVADYKSSRVGVGCHMSDCVCLMSPLFIFHDGITFERFKLEGWTFVWGLIMEIFKSEPMETSTTPTTPTTLTPSETVAMG